VHATTAREARRLNRAGLGRSVSPWTWGICPKIAQVDALLLANTRLKERVREVHPEVCFWALAGKKPMRFTKGSQDGQAERLAVLQGVEPAMPDFLNRVLRETPRKDVKADDVVDALVALVAAEAARDRLATLVGDPAEDQRGLPMEMVYLDP
jgi:predicted RNase H-like nuclease